MVDLPDPVGPVARMIPYGWARALRKRASLTAENPSVLRSRQISDWSRITAEVPHDVGAVSTRMSICLPPSGR